MFLQDNKSFTRERAEMEVDKFLMDAEMMSVYINYQKKKASGALQEIGDNVSNPNIWNTYLTWFLAFFAFNYVRKIYIDPKFASGEWKVPFFSGGEDSAAETVVQTVSSVQSVIDTISDTVTAAM